MRNEFHLCSYLLSLALLAGGFSESFTCTITGYAYGAQNDESSFSRSDGCQMVKHRVERGTLLMSSQHYWAMIVLPVTGGHQALTYHWGSSIAHLRGEDWPVSWGLIKTS